MLQHVLAVTVDNLQGAPKTLACADNVSTYMVGILLHITKIFIMDIKYYNS